MGKLYDKTVRKLIEWSNVAKVRADSSVIYARMKRAPIAPFSEESSVEVSLKHLISRRFFELETLLKIIHP